MSNGQDPTGLLWVWA